MAEDLQAKIIQTRKEIDQIKEETKANRDAKEDTTMKKFTSEIPGVTRSDHVKFKRGLRGHISKIYAMHWANDSTHLVSASQDGLMLTWDGQTTNKIHCIRIRSSWVMTCAYAPSMKFVACGGLDNIVSIYSVAPKSTSSEPLNNTTSELAGHVGYISCMRYVDENRILTSSGDATCCLWDVEQSTKIMDFKDHQADVMCVSVSPDQNTFISGACDSTAKLWDMRTESCVASFAGHDADINAIAYHPSGNAFITGSDDFSCKLFDIRADRELMNYSTDSMQHGVTSVTVSGTGRYLFCGYDDLGCLWWDVLKGDCITKLTGHENRVSCLGVSPDGYALCTGSWDSTLRIWAN
ncbi:Guanine nucleotide-binding protein subunit beta [Entamoeba marina]